MPPKYSIERNLAGFLPNGKPFPPKVLARRAKHAAMKAAHPERYMTRKETADRIKALEDEVKKLKEKP